MADEQDAKDEGVEREGEGRPVFRDKRRIDPETGEARTPPSEAEPADADAASPEVEPQEVADELSAEDRVLLDDAARAVADERARLEAEAAEQLGELQRLRAEYVNYRNRVERERAADHAASVAGVVKALLPALDDLALAEQHGDLAEGSPLAIVAQKLRGAFSTLDLHEVGEVGEAFDTASHEAIAQLPNPQVTEMTVADVVQRGYRIGDRLLRPAKVAVFVPAEADAGTPSAE